MRFVPFFAVLMLLAMPARAEIHIYDIEKPHTQIIFSVNHLGFSHSYGKFTDHTGKILYNEGEPAKSSVEITIPATSLEMHDQKWNDHLKSPDFFNVEKFPNMTFKSTAIAVTGPDTADITGDLTLLGVTRPVVLKTKQNKVGKHPMREKYAAGFSAATTIKRSDFGMGYGVPMISDEVNIIIEVESIREGAEATNP